MHFLPFREALPEFIHVSTASVGDWLSSVVLQIVQGVDDPHSGEMAILERLTEIALLEVLRRQLSAEPNRTTGWLAGWLPFGIPSWADVYNSFIAILSVHGRLRT